MPSTSESLLIRMRADENSDAWSEFVSLYTPLIFYWAQKNGLRNQDAADLAQDVLTIVFKKLPTWQYNREKSFRGWLRTVTLNRHRELIRKQKSKPTSHNGHSLEELMDPRHAESTWDANYHHEIVTAAIKLMKQDFSTATWTALQQLLSSGQPAAKISRECGISVWTLYAAKNRLFSRLRSKLDGLLD